MFATPELMRLVMRKKPGVLSDLSADDKISLLGYLLSDSNSLKWQVSVCNTPLPYP